MTTLATNTTLINEMSSYDFHGAMIYIFGVLIWYALGFGLILLDDLNPSAGEAVARKYISVYQAVSDLHEQQARNDILLELKDQDRRTRLWQIYYGTKTSHPVTVQKDQETIELIIKQLNELNERRRLLRHTLNEISFDQDDADSDTESFHSSQTTNKTHEQFINSYLK